jgi:CBS domain-containing protein
VTQPSPALIDTARRFLAEHPPFSQMPSAELDPLLPRLELAYFADGEIIVAPADGVPTACWIVRQGVVAGHASGAANDARAGGGVREPAMQLTPGEIFPAGALLAQRAVSNTYRAQGDVFCWRLARSDFDDLVRRSPVFLDFCRRRMAVLLDLSRQALQASYAVQVAQSRALEQPLVEVMRRDPYTCTVRTSLREAFEGMEARGVGSVIVVDESAPGAVPTVAGIFTRQDVLARVVLSGVTLGAPVGSVMSAPVSCLDSRQSVADAMLLMAERAIRHIPVTGADGRLEGIVSERDLFVLQRRGLSQIGDAIRGAASVPALRQAAADIREWSFALVAQGVSPGFITRLISRLNDQLTARLVGMLAATHPVNLDQVCWLALGSEGREEQTIATDQDNGLVIAPECSLARADLLAFGDAVNHALADCGFPLCEGGIMAGNPLWCLSLDEWAERFDDWIARGDPQSLLHAAIFFDFRAVAGAQALADQLAQRVGMRARANPRFLKQMSDNALHNRPPSGFIGGLLEPWKRSAQGDVDLKMHGTVPFVDAARVLSLAHGVAHPPGTVARLEALALAQVLRSDEVAAWIDAFQFLQGLRLRAQQRSRAPGRAANVMALASLSELDRRVLKEAFRQARKLQQRLEMDYP